MIYEIEITHFAPDPIVERYAGATSEDAVQQIQLDQAIEFVVFVAALDRERNVDWGNFCVWCNAERALIELREHREHYATDPLLQPEQTREVRFRDEDGSSFSVPYQRTVTRDQALAAMRFWLPFQEHTPELAWS
ncbi:MAG TPA: hypothetical protein VGS07_27795 [Thermoanaerobaculia bacterium]|jgi:hypothetical protein|nr:hypothetical protein [Thermoanaerobaculia bacterium]